MMHAIDDVLANRRKWTVAQGLTLSLGRDMMGTRQYGPQNRIVSQPWPSGSVLSQVATGQGFSASRGHAMKSIELTQGFVTMVDDEDYEELMRYKWHVLSARGRRFYAVRTTPIIGGRHHMVYMHRQILGVGPDEQVDHHSQVTLDNQRTNIRRCTRSQNAANSRKKRGCTSRFKGVHFHKTARKWCARIKKDGVSQHLGLFTDERDAARAYNVAAIEHFREFARLNEING